MSNQAELETTQFAPEDKMRANLYSLLGTLLLQHPSTEMLQQLASLHGNDGDVGDSINALSKIARALDATSVEREFNVLFIGVGRGEVLPYGSYYLTGFLHEQPLANLRASMRKHGVRRREGIAEPEDHLGALCEMMAGLISGAFGTPTSVLIQQEFFNAHIAPWASHCFSDLEKAESAVLYAPVGSLGRQFMAIEQESFRIG